MYKGFGKDAFVMACLGCHVTLVERNVIVYEIVKNALEKAQALVIKNRCFFLFIV